MEPVIDCRALGRRFGNLTALAGVDVTVHAGEAVALFGPNGAGKTTLLRLLATLLRPTAGELRLFGAPLRDGGLAARRSIGFLGHQSFLYPDLTPSENLTFYARIFRVADASKRVRALLDRVGLLGWAHRPVRTLSRGLEQRCALARALVHEPRLLLLDEPFTGLDADAAAMLSELLVQAHERGTTLLLVTHDRAPAFVHCRRGIILVHGRVVWKGSLAEPERDAFTQAYRELTRPRSVAA
jgi:heme exporter protein A